MNTKDVILALAIAAVFLVAAVGSASADEAITSLPFTTNEDGERYYLTGDLTCTNTANAITIAHNNVLIDGQGNKITGNVAAGICTGGSESNPVETHSGILNKGGYDNVVVEDLEIENFCTGVTMGHSTTDVENMTVTGCKIHDCGDSSSITHGIHLSGAHHSTITKNEVYNIAGTADMGSCGSGGNGICMFGGDAAGKGDWNDITCNHLHDNAKCGLHAKKKCMHNIISYNNASGNAGAGIMPECKKTDWNTFQYNTMSNNGFGGFYTCGNNNTISYNTLIHNGHAMPGGYGLEINAGLKMGSPYGTNNDVINNTVCDSSGNDIVTTNNAQGNTNTVESNTCKDLERGGVVGSCDWSCGSLTTVYYDFDEDEHYSKDSADCECGICGGKGKGACCNPGLFNGSDDAKASYEASCNCQWTAGDDINDCDPGITGEEISYYCDVDSDGYISASVSGTGTEIPPGCQATPGDDCDDTNPNVNPGATENCTNGIDDDCDGLTDMADPDCAAPGEEVTVSATVAVAAPEVVCKCEGPDDDPVKPGTQVEPNLWPDTKTVMKCAIVCDPNGIDNIKYVNATTYYPNTTIKETQTMHVANDTEKAACCCDTTGLPNETCQVYAGYITMEACDPAGNYTVTVTATDNSSATGELSNTFEYLSIIGLDLDLSAVGFGTIVPGETKVVPGDGVWGAPNLTVHSIGNGPVDIEVSATDMTSDGNTITKDNIGCEIDALGSQWLNAPRTFSIDLECCSYENVNLSLHVPEGTAQGAYTGKVTFVAKHA